ncbi:MAG: outer membrane protein assembly factor BamB [Gammaproteobacteria bacterium]|nr:outer membrane protein assembly factor BamB [Gammaproteobacteria bacterium]
MKKIFWFALLVMSLAACVSNNVEPPAPLVPFTPGVKVERIWSTSVGSADAILRLGIVVASDSVNVYAADHGGDVYAFSLKSGKRLWRTETKLPLSGGPGAGAGLVVVGASDGTVVALNAADGSQVWKATVNGAVLASPAVSPQAVIVHTSDGHIVALSLAAGQTLWSVSRDVPNLTLRGSGVPLIVGGTVLQGLATGQLLALNLSDGSQRWLATVSAATGSNELARLVDMDGVLAADDSNVFAVNYQGRVADVALDTGQILWARDMSSYTGVSADAAHVYVTDVHSAVWALDKTTGVPAWTQPAMRARDLTVPVPFGDTVVAGDLDGYVFFLSKKDGSIVARVGLGGAPILAPPIVVNDTLIVLSTNGDIAAYKLAPLKQ